MATLPVGSGPGWRVVWDKPQLDEYGCLRSPELPVVPWPRRRPAGESDTSDWESDESDEIWRAVEGVDMGVPGEPEDPPVFDDRPAVLAMVRRARRPRFVRRRREAFASSRTKPMNPPRR